jgi:hypothetical protein
MVKLLRALSLAFTAVLFGCATAGSVKVVQTKDFKYKATDTFLLSHNTAKDGQIKQAGNLSTVFEAKFAEALQKSGVYPAVVKSGAKYAIQYYFKEVDEPSALLNLAATGSGANSEVTLDVKIVVPPKQLVATLEVKGDSSMDTRTSIGSFNITSVSKKSMGAATAAAERLVDYLVQNGENYKKE